MCTLDDKNFNSNFRFSDFKLSNVDDPELDPEEDKVNCYCLKTEKNYKDGESNREAPFLYLCTISVILLSFTSGISISWTSPIFPRINDEDKLLFGEWISVSQKAWIASCLPLGAAIGPQIAGYCSDIFGRKKVLLGVAMPMLLGYFTLLFSNEIELWYFARFIIGLSVGSSLAIVPLYLGEITQSFNRGKLGCFMGLSLSLGINYPLSIGPHLSTTLYAFSCTVPLIVFIVVFGFLMPETPYHLVKSKNVTSAERALKKLRPKGNDIQSELYQITENVKSTDKQQTNLKVLFLSKISRRALFTAIGVLSIHQFAGINPLLAYMKTIFEASGSTIHPNVCTLIIGCVEVSAHVLCIAVVEKFRRRTILMISCAGCSLSIFTLGVYFYLQSQRWESIHSIFWLPVTCLVIYNIFFGLSLGPLPYTIVGELFPNHVKGISAAFCATTNFLVSSLITFTFPIVSQYIGMYGMFWIFSINCIFGLLFIYLFLPETQGKSLEEIQDILKETVK